MRAWVDGCDDVVTTTAMTSPSDPSSTCDRPAANAASFAEMASRAHAVVEIFLCARIGAGFEA
eukprot:6211424-Pleurochrysis_carterae.AAC.9